ncbi:MAG: 3-deoxy-D-manno-octulosonic acid transferase [Phycisphaerae bacterium]
MWLLLDCAYGIAGLACLPLLVYQRFVLGKRRGGWRQRFGRLPPRKAGPPCIWIHAVSLGETNATRGIVEAIRKELPDREVVISTTTDTGYARAKELYPDLYVFRYPLDFSWVVRRVLDTIRPAVIVLMELEVWPNLVLLASDRGIAVAVANGRLTEERTMRRFRKPVVRRLARRMFGRLAWVGAQNATYAERFRELGVPADRLHVTGLLKWDTAQVADTLPGTEALRTATGIAVRGPHTPDGDRPFLWVCGQTGPGEEEVVLDAYRLLRERWPAMQLAVIPRKPERFDEVARLIAKQGWSYVRRSEHPDGAGPPAGRPDVILGDTMGELRKFYCLADVVFVGRSLVPMGGSDVVEVAALARPIIVGPHTENFADSVAELRAAGAIVVCPTGADDPAAARTLAELVAGLLTGEAAGAMGLAARRVVQENQGVTQRTVTALVDLVNRAQH